MKRILKMTMVLFSFLILVSCSLPGLASNTDEDTISITDEITSEAQILTNLVAGMVEYYTDKDTAVISNLATTTTDYQATVNGGASISTAHYTETDLITTLNLLPEEDPKKTFEIMKDELGKGYNQTWFPSYGFGNTYVFLVRKDTAQKCHLSKVSDLENVADELVAGTDTSQINHEGDGYSGFQEIYDFFFDSTLPTQIGLVYDVVETDKIGTVLGYPTDERVTSYDLVMLGDGYRFFPPYNTAPVIDNKVLADTPHLKEASNELGYTISTEKMQESNYETDNSLVEPSIVAQCLLQENHHFEGK